MILVRTLSSMSLAVSVLAFTAAPAGAQSTTDPVRYGLASPPSQFEVGCFGPCACPVLIRSPLSGSFVLRRSHVDPLYTYYDVLDVRWRVSDSTQPVATITGSGTYRLGGEVALMEELTLDLSFDGGPVQRFTSGLRPPGAPFPEIATRISLHDEFCLDSVLAVDAKPLGVAGVDGGGLPSLTVGPNPFTSTTEISFALTRDGVVEMGVFDLTGRRVSSIVGRQWLASGTHHRSWDGRRDGHAVAPPGVYMVRMDTPAGSTQRTLVKLR
jgi:hypothetical protein